MAKQREEWSINDLCSVHGYFNRSDNDKSEEAKKIIRQIEAEISRRLPDEPPRS